MDGGRISDQFSSKRVVSQVFVLSQPLYRQASILVEGFSVGSWSRGTSVNEGGK